MKRLRLKMKLENSLRFSGVGTVNVTSFILSEGDRKLWPKGTNVMLQGQKGGDEMRCVLEEGKMLL